jgi:dTDP-4-amino-4,6-dideoxygalactose transaminase
MNSDILCSNPRLQFISQQKEITESILRVLSSDTYILGTEVSAFEDEFAEYLGVENCIGVNSGTDALILGLRALNISIGDEVITPSHTAVATVAAIVATGAIPIFVDIDKDSYTIDPQKVIDSISAKTKAIIAVHLYGNSCDMNSMCQISKDHGIYLIEDCSQAHGAKWGNRKLGTFGILACFSFYPTKNLGAIGDGGAIVTNNVKLADLIRKMRQYGWDSEKISQLTSSVTRLDEIQAAILRAKLRNLDSQNLKRQEIALAYGNLLSDSNLLLPLANIESEHVYHLYVIRIKNRDKIIAEMNSTGIFPGVHYRLPVHLHPAYKQYRHLSADKLNNTEEITEEILSLPMYPELSVHEVERICKVLVNY